MFVYALGIMSSALALAILRYGYQKSREADASFRLRDLVTGRRSYRDTSRRQLLIEGYFLLLLSVAMLVYKLLT